MTPAQSTLAMQSDILDDTMDLQSVVYSEIQQGAAPIAAALNMPNLVAVDEASLGDFPWFWQNGTNFNASTFKWLNSLMSYNSSDGYVGTNGQALTTSLFNVTSAIAYVLDAADASALNKAVLANAPLVNTIITTWTSTVGQIPTTYTTQMTQLNYIMSQILSWGVPGLTLAKLRTSLNPIALLPNIPLGGDAIANYLMTYLGNTTSVARIQSAVAGFNYELAQVINNIAPQPPLTASEPGFMTTVDDHGITTIEVAIDVTESTAQIQSNLIPAEGTGKSFSTSFSVTKQASNTVQISANGNVGVGGLGDFLTFSGGARASYDMFSADASLTECTVSMTYNGVTTFTPKNYAYNVTDGSGWWLPDPIEEAANPMENQSGYKFIAKPAYNFGVNGDFGAIARLMVSQQPIISLSYVTSNYAAFQEIFQEQSNWSVSFLGIPIAGGSQSYYRCNTSYNEETTTVTVTMVPVGVTTPVLSTDQLANVVGAQVVWPGASAQQNRAGI